MENTSNSTILKNTILLYVRMAVMLAIGLYTSRVLLATLGFEDFGLYNVVGGVIVLTNVLTVSVSSAGVRFLTYYLGRDNSDNLKEIFGNLLTVYAILALIVLLLGETIGIWLVTEKLVIPEGRLVASMWVYQLSIIAAIINVISLPYNSVIIAHERMSAFAYITFLDAILKLLIVYITLVSPFDKLIAYAVLVLLIQIFDRIMYGVYCARNFSEVNVRPLVNLKLIKRITSYSLWATIGGIGYMGYTQGLNILLNMFFGPVVNAARALSVQVETKTRSFSENFQLAVKPQIIKNYAINNLERVRQLVVLSSKFSFYLILLIALPISFEINQILSWWLVDVPNWTGAFVKITFCITGIRILADPLFQVIHAEGNIRNFQIVEGGILILILPICYVLLKQFHVSPIVPYFALLALEILAQCVRMAFALPIAKFSLKDYLRLTIIPIAKVLCFSLAIILLSRNEFPIIRSNTILGLIDSFLVTAISVYFIGCQKNEKKQIIKKISLILERFLHALRIR